MQTLLNVIDHFRTIVGKLTVVRGSSSRGWADVARVS